MKRAHEMSAFPNTPMIVEHNAQASCLLNAICNSKGKVSHPTQLRQQRPGVSLS
jgi:hypothetical protein